MNQSALQQTIVACEQHADAADYWRKRAAHEQALRMRLTMVYYVLTILSNPRLAVP